MKITRHKPSSTLQRYFSSSFFERHVGPSEKEIKLMLKSLDIESLDKLVKKTIPNELLIENFDIGEPVPPEKLLKLYEETSNNNSTFPSYLGQGFYGTITPPIIMKNIIENPVWYTPYTPYQSEIAQGRLESLHNFQTLITELTGFDIAGASLLDEGSAASEAMIMCYNICTSSKKTFVVDEFIFEPTLSVIKTVAKPLGINIVVMKHLEVLDALRKNTTNSELDVNDVFGMLIQYPNSIGNIENCKDYTNLSRMLHQHNAKLVCATDLLALTLIKSPREIGADIAIGNCQRMGVPMYYGGPHAAFCASTKEFLRFFPGKFVGSTSSSNSPQVPKLHYSHPVYRLSLQTREQHIKKDKATSNICTSQCLLANVCAMYAIYHGPSGLREIAERIHKYTSILKGHLVDAGYTIRNNSHFDTITIENKDCLMEHPRTVKIFKLNANGSITISLDETTTLKDVEGILDYFDILVPDLKEVNVNTKSYEMCDMKRTDKYLKQPVFNLNKSETNFLRYITSLGEKDLSLIHSMIPLGSCTMKLNSPTTLFSLGLEGFRNLHPYSSNMFSHGFSEIFEELENYLTKISGLDATCLQPNSGSQGEYTGLRMIKAYVDDTYPDNNRNICLIPKSAHGTNFASARKAGLKVVQLKTTESGEISVDDLSKKIEKYKDQICCMMITYPSTYGFFEGNITEVCELVRTNGGQIYLDGANMNAQVGLSNLRNYVDVMHYNIHKTFSTPHGGGGPGSGPISFKKHLKEYAPSGVYNETDQISSSNPIAKSIGNVASTKYGNSALLPVAWGYIKMLGTKGLMKSTQIAILNANYMAKRLEKHYKIMYTNKNGMVAHEFIIDLSPFLKCGVNANDFTKRLQDYSYHAPTVSWPVPNSLMIEPTESESLQELDRFCNVMINIKQECDEILSGKYPKDNNVMKCSPHTIEMSMNEWDKPYSKQKAFYPMDYLKENKFWPRCTRIDEAMCDKMLYSTLTSKKD